jgi:hypothetical protein
MCCDATGVSARLLFELCMYSCRLPSISGEASQQHRCGLHYESRCRRTDFVPGACRIIFLALAQVSQVVQLFETNPGFPAPRS